MTTEKTITWIETKLRYIKAGEKIPQDWGS